MGKILVIGDSISYGKWDSHGGWVARLRQEIDLNHNIGKGGNNQVYNLGIPGELSIRLPERTQSELQHRTNKNEQNVVIFGVGTNDSSHINAFASRQILETEFKESLTKAISIAKDFSCKVFVLGLGPVGKTDYTTNEQILIYDKYISEIAEESKVTKIELNEQLTIQGYAEHLVDGIHPDDEGHRMIFEIVSDALQSNDLAKI